MNRARKNRRNKHVLSIGDILSQRRIVTDARARLGQVRRLFATVVGPTTAKESTVIRLEAGRLTIGVPGAGMQRQMESVQSYLVRVINERMGANTVKDVHFIHLRHVAHPNRRVAVPVTSEPRQFSQKLTEAANAAAVSVPDKDLREQLVGWFKLMLAKSETSV
jgi:hypothetical protein